MEEGLVNSCGLAISELSYNTRTLGVIRCEPLMAPMTCAMKAFQPFAEVSLACRPGLAAWGGQA